MPPRTTTDDDGDDDLDDWSEEDEDATVPCPYCHRDIHEDAERCPYCDQYISAEDAPPTPKPVWIIAGAIVCLLIVYLWISRGW